MESESQGVNEKTIRENVKRMESESQDVNEEGRAAVAPGRRSNRITKEQKRKRGMRSHKMQRDARQGVKRNGKG